ncbi:single-stranded DNA-binding protein [Candidatus Skiveiella danica]|uniref:single-stranded DNA-binding protein n=1 Tax=Candidatus Skiveiella danica TaxID=3386177 RepID=UPI0039B88031
MIDALISGRLRGTPSVRTSSNGAPYALFRLSAADKTGATLFCSCIAFSATAIEAVQRLTDGDSIAVSGEIAISTWSASDGSPRHGLDVTAHQVLTPYQVTRKRKTADAPQADATEAGQ